MYCIPNRLGCCSYTFKNNKDLYSTYALCNSVMKISWMSHLKGRYKGFLPAIITLGLLRNGKKSRLNCCSQNMASVQNLWPKEYVKMAIYENVKRGDLRALWGCQSSILFHWKLLNNYRGDTLNRIIRVEGRIVFALLSFLMEAIYTNLLLSYLDEPIINHGVNT